jgi:hypothetical protein
MKLPWRGLAALGLVVAAWAMIGIPAHATYGARVSADEPQYLLSAMSLGTDVDLDISDELAEERTGRSTGWTSTRRRTARRDRPPDQPP